MKYYRQRVGTCPPRNVRDDGLKASIPIDILPQPDDTTCGPTCLHAIYRHYGEALPLEQVIREVPAQSEGGTLGAWLACHALRRGYRATIYTFNLRVFDPSWFGEHPADLTAKLTAQARIKTGRRMQWATRAYLEYLALGGVVCFEDMSVGLIRRHLRRGTPVIAGLSATYLYRAPRERDSADRVIADDVGGVPAGHFVLLCGYQPRARAVSIADPYPANPFARGTNYRVAIERVQCAIMLSVLSYDANLVVIEPPENRSFAPPLSAERHPPGAPHAHPRRRQ